MKQKIISLILVLFLYTSYIYSQDYLRNTTSQVKKQMSDKYPNMDIRETNRNDGGKTLWFETSKKQHFAFFNKKGICFIEKIYPSTDFESAVILFDIESKAYDYYYNRKTDIHTYKIKVPGKGVLRIDFTIDDKGYSVFELYYLKNGVQDKMMD